MLKTHILPSLSGVVASGKANLDVPRGPTYHKIIFTVAGVALAIAHIGRINVFFNGKIVQTYKNLQRLMDMNSYKNKAADTVNQFALHFFQREMSDQLYRHAPGVGTIDLQTFQIEIELTAAFPVGGTIVAHAELDVVPQPLGVFYSVREHVFSSATAGQFEVATLPKGPFYSCIHLFKSDVTDVELEIDQTMVVRATKTVLERVQKEASPIARVPVSASATHIDMTVRGDLADSINTATVSDFRLRMTMTTAGTVDIVTEVLTEMPKLANAA